MLASYFILDHMKRRRMKKKKRRKRKEKADRRKKCTQNVSLKI
jgi:hypothetical protein